MTDGASPDDVTLYWDFFGPRAEGTARHFDRHLAEFLAREGVEGCEHGVSNPGRGLWSVWCRTLLEQEEDLVRALRPRRREPEPQRPISHPT